jgi:hypothetical protein
MDNKWAKFFSLPPHLTWDYIGGLIMGMGFGCLLASELWMPTPKPDGLMGTFFVLLIGGAFVRRLGSRTRASVRSS